MFRYQALWVSSVSVNSHHEKQHEKRLTASTTGPILDSHGYVHTILHTHVTGGHPSGSNWWMVEVLGPAMGVDSGQLMMAIPAEFINMTWFNQLNSYLHPKVIDPDHFWEATYIIGACMSNFYCWQIFLIANQRISRQS